MATRALVHPAAVAALALACGMLGACAGASDVSTTGAPSSSSATSTFSRLQSSVLTPSCAVSGCHVSASAAASGNLVLAPDVAYDNLVNAVPTNLSARRDGLKRVVPFKPDSSVLFQKVVLALAAHGGEYGNTMPVGSAPLTQGQVDFIQRWIAAGAPRTGDVVYAALLKNTAAQPSTPFVKLAPPAGGAGFQVRVDSFGVQSNFERELFVYRPVGNSADVYVSRIQTSMRPMSHHLALYTIDPSMAPGFPCTPQTNVVRDIRNADGSLNLLNMIPMACHVFLAGSQSQSSDYVFPAGVALRVPASLSIDVNVHYVNRTDAAIPGEAYANLYTVPLAQVEQVASTLNMSNTGISLPAGRETTLEKTFIVAQTTTIFMLTSHMHALGTKFQIRIVGGARDGETVYESTDWAHPQTLTFSPAIVLQKGQGLKSVVTWNNTTAHTVTFGLQSTDEMGIIFGYYY
jgi:hypothetical protein